MQKILIFSRHTDKAVYSDNNTYSMLSEFFTSTVPYPTVFLIRDEN